MTAQTALTRQQLKASKREAVLDAALQLFATKGFEATAVPEIAKAAGVSTGAIYVYFPDKKTGLVNALYQKWKNIFLEALGEAIDPEQSYEMQFANLWAGMCKFSTHHSDAFTFLEMHFHAPYLDEDSRKIEEAVLLMSREFVLRGMETGEVEPGDPDLLITLVFGSFVELVKQQRLGRLETGKAIFKTAEKRLWKMISV